MTRAITEKGRASQQKETTEDRVKRERANNWRMVLERPAGRFVLRELIKKLMDQDIWEGNSECQKKAVQHDFGRWIEAQIRDIDPSLLILMAQEDHQESFAADIRIQKHEENEEENKENLY